MGFIDRLILFIYGLLVFVMSVTVFLVFAGLFSQGYLWGQFVIFAGGSQSAASVAAGAGAFVFALLSLRVLKLSVKCPARNKKIREAVIVRGGIGDVQITVEAIKNLVDKKAKSIKGVREAKVKVDVKAGAEKENVNILLSMVVGQEHNIKEISDQTRAAVKESLQNVVGLEDFSFDIVVDDISNAPVQKQRVI